MTIISQDLTIISQEVFRKEVYEEYIRLLVASWPCKPAGISNMEAYARGAGNRDVRTFRNLVRGEYYKWSTLLLYLRWANPPEDVAIQIVTDYLILMRRSLTIQEHMLISPRVNVETKISIITAATDIILAKEQ